MPETIVLDPSEVATSRTQIDLTPWVSAEGIDWGDAEIAAYMADQSRGSSPVDFRVPNRTITIPLVLKAVGGTTFATARTNMQAKTALFQREGGWLKRLTSTGGTVFADVVNATLKLGGGWMQAHRSADTDAQLVLEAIPDFYGAEIQLADHTETSATEIVFTETGVLGDYPGRVRIVVDDDEGQSQLGLLWSMRQRHYSAASTAATRYEAEALTTLDTATRAALTGASGGTVVTHGTVSTNWTPIMNTNLQAGTFLTHTGTNRLFARYRTTSGTAVMLRSVYDVGDLTLPVENTAIRANAGTAFFIADLGELRLDPSPVGAHRWQGQIQGKGEAGTENVSIDKVWVLGVDDGFGKLTAPISSTTTGLATYVARDEFNQSAGALTGKTAAVGGVWVGAGDADDFSVETTGKTAQRTGVSDSISIGRWVVLGTTNYTDIVAQVDFKRSVEQPAYLHGVFARYTDSNNWVMAIAEIQAANNPYGRLILRSRLAGVMTDVTFSGVPAIAAEVWMSLRLQVDAAGRWHAWLWPRGGVPGTPYAGQNSDLASGTLASGKVGIYDEYFWSGANTRSYNNFLAWVPAADAVVYASRTAQISTDGVRRLDSTGTAYGPVSDPGADLPRIPPAGLEGRTTEFFVKLSRGDFGQLPDTGIDNGSVRVNYRPSYLFLP